MVVPSLLLKLYLLHEQRWFIVLGIGFSRVNVFFIPITSVLRLTAQTFSLVLIFWITWWHVPLSCRAAVSNRNITFATHVILIIFNSIKSCKTNEITFNICKYYDINIKIMDQCYFCTKCLKSAVYFTLILNTFQY